MPADHRSIHPGVAGVPWWAAVLVAVTMTLIGFGFDATTGTKELTGVFATFYVLGCVGAVLAVRQSGVFTAVIQPPLILFGAVPGAYFLFHGSSYGGLRNLLINCGYPLIERFPLMLFTSALVLLIGVIRWLLGLASPAAAAEVEETPTESPLAVIAAKLRSIWGGGSEPTSTGRRIRRHTVDREPTERPRRRPRPEGAEQPARRRRPRPAEETPERRRRQRTRDAARTTDRPRRPRPRREYDPTEAVPPPRRRPTPRDPLREPRTGGYERRTGRYESSTASEWAPPRRPRVPTTADNGTHHPVSRVRYRGAPEPRSPRGADSWEFDI
ncbi:hypothetical protein AWC30_08295 [Mycolicibacillus trivialis]|uniref:DUF6542 domain-containing protein n=1 Tax=Mycolicibacillus trivialis TaxID=1798 RepID=A0A1X2ELC1_9MYCO|nr:hypothetical protein AWC30_08295 [Mycolicibacillus trivialis]